MQNGVHWTESFLIIIIDDLVFKIICIRLETSGLNDMEKK